MKTVLFGRFLRGKPWKKRGKMLFFEKGRWKRVDKNTIFFAKNVVYSKYYIMI